VAVLVPAHDEASTIRSCLSSIDVAAAAWGGPVTVVVGADRCTDATARLARSCAIAPPLTVVEGAWCNAGANRRAITAVALNGVGQSARARVWLANTDADGTVPPDWLTAQVAAADRGADVVLGTVQLDLDATPAPLVTAFRRRYRLEGATHTHVHGANVGLRASVLAAAGGWARELAAGEDRDLVQRCIQRGARVHRTTAIPVVTSSRTIGRARHGFAADLAALAAFDGASA
jgi:glycosyltransferase involved in cell wall biosynthesis